MAKMRSDPVLRFWSKVQRGDGCWLWRGYVSGRYGRIKIAGKHRSAHRYAYELLVGSVPPGNVVCHHCDTPLCVNPDHLFLGTQLDNVRDCMAKGRRAELHGEQRYNAKLTDARVMAIRSDARPQRVIATEYGIHQSVVSRIKAGQRWRHVECP